MRREPWQVILHVLLLIVILPATCWASVPAMTVVESGSGIDHTVTVESAGQFRIAFEASMNYGLTKWFDLVNDPAALTDIVHNPTDYLPAHEQSSLFNHCIQQNDVIGHVASARLYNQNTPRTLAIVENNPLRVIIEVSYSPMLGTVVNNNIVFTDRYVIYADGKIYISNHLHSLSNQSVGEWRNSVIGLGDPFYGVKGDTAAIIANNQLRTLTDTRKNWIQNAWSGYAATIGYNAWEILGNTANTLQIGRKLSGGGADVLVDGAWSIATRRDKYGWIRATDTQNPYDWSGTATKYLFEYWDPGTPFPYTDWTKASVLLVPRANNPFQGIQAMHGWKGFKRWYYSVGSLALTAGQDIYQYYMMQLGTQGSSFLPSVTTSTTANSIAGDYLNPATLMLAKGSLVDTGYDVMGGTYVLRADANEVQLSIDGSIQKRYSPVFEIADYNSVKKPQVVVDGVVVQYDVDYVAALSNATTLLVKLQKEVASNVSIIIGEGTIDFPIPTIDTQSPSVPSGFTASTRSSSQIDLLWNASTDNLKVAGYRVMRNGTTISSQGETSYSDTGCAAGSTYVYTVAAFDEAGNISMESAPVTASTQSNIPQVSIARKDYAILDYNTATPDYVINWINERFIIKISGRNPGNASMHWDTYMDIYGPASPSELLYYKDWADSKGVKYEDMLLHAKVDYTSAIGTAWNQMDKFDQFEGANGILTSSDDVTYNDFTSTAYSANMIWRNSIYIGYEEPFDQINLVFSTPGVGVQDVWEYWNGLAWKTLGIRDGTNLFTVNGSLLFTPPQDWGRRSINGSRKKYFIRCRILAALSNPITSAVKGDNWLRGAGNLCRGWDPTSSSVVNTGELVYNPTPPAGASAKFPYQARISYWAANHFVANPADFQNIDGFSVRTWAMYVANVIVGKVSTLGYTGVMCDDGERDVSSDGIPSASTDFMDKSATTWDEASVAKYQDIVNLTKALNPSVKVGINAQGKSYVKKGDWNLAEYHSFNWKTASPLGITSNAASTTMSYDDYLPPNNTSGVVGVMIYQDTADIVPGKTALWDRGNRGPLTALSKHYIGMNVNTLFSYYSKGGYVYSDTDEVYLKDSTVRHQSVDAIPTVDLVKRWATYFPSMGVGIGSPDPQGYNGGARSLAWKLHAEIGGIQDVWRRDFTDAIVLHRPASWDTTDAEYNTYSTQMVLGGTYYPLRADGTTAPGITQIALRTGEGAILMKTSLTPLPPPPSGLSSPKNLKVLP